MPFKSEAQRRACYAANDPNWDCKEYERHTPKGKLPKRVCKKKRKHKRVDNAFCPTGPGGGIDPTCSPGRKAVKNARRRPINPLRADPTRTATLRRSFLAVIRQTFRKLRLELIDLIEREDALGLREPTANTFCPTGEGGGVDPTCSPGRRILPIDEYDRDRVFKDVSALALGSGARVSGERAITSFGRSETGIARFIEVKRYRDIARIDFGIVGQEATYQAPSVQAGSLDLTKRLRSVVRVYHNAGFKIQAAAADQRRKELYGKVLTKMGLELGQGDVWNYLVSNQRWSFHSSPEKVKAFQDWIKSRLRKQVTSDREAWEQYIQAGFHQGASRSFDDTTKAEKALKQSLATGKDKEARTKASKETLDFYDGSRRQFLSDVFAQPTTVEKVQLLTGRVFEDLGGVSADMAARMTRHLTDGLTKGQSPRDIARALADDVDIGRSRAEVIARTEIIRAHAEGQLTALENLGVEEVGVAVEWSSTGDERVCELCQPLEGVVLKLEEARGMLPRHPNAVFAGSTFVSYGECQELVRAWYWGPAVVLTLGGGEYGTTIGPNHPVMTRRGMVPATQLQEGDEVLYDLRGNRSAASLNVEQVPTVQNVFESSLGVPGHAGVVASASDLHGDRVFCQGEVQGIRPAGGLLQVRDSCGIEQLRQDNFAGSDTDSLLAASLGPGQFTGGRVHGSPAGIVGSLNLVGALAVGHPIPFQPFRLGLSAQRHAGGSQAVVDWPRRYPETSGNRHGRFSADVPPHNFFVWKTVHAVSFTEYKGWAFDATTATSLYCSDNLVVSNCRCAWLPANVGEDDEGRKEGKAAIERAIRRSVALGDDDFGPGTAIAKDRPRSIFNVTPALGLFSRLTRNAFCPTGEGGGIDPTCSPGGTSQGSFQVGYAENYTEALAEGERLGVKVVAGVGGTPVSRDQLNAINRQVAKLPPQVLEVVRQAGSNLEVVGGNGITDYPSNAHLKGVTPRGWEGTGKTWDDVPGASATKAGDSTIIAARGMLKPESHGSVNLILHEHGHTVDLCSGRLSRGSDWQQIHRSQKWSDTYQSRYPEESWAESFAAYYDGPTSRNRLPAPVQSYFKEKFE